MLKTRVFSYIFVAGSMGLALASLT